MHIAMCLDIAAQRKHLERLLGRSADKRMAREPEVPIYIQSYGNKEPILNRCSMYDLFLIHITTDSISSIDFIRDLRSRGVLATIALCPDENIDLSVELTKEDNVFVLRQPFDVAKIDELLDIAANEMLNRVPKINLRSNTETINLLPEEINYVEGKNEHTFVHYGAGAVFEAPELIENFWKRAATVNTKGLYCLSDKLIVNKAYIESIGFGSVTLKDSTKHRVNHKRIKYMETH